MPTDASGSIITTQICQTQNLFIGSNLATSTQYCYNSRDVYVNFGIEFFIIAGIIMAAGLIYRFLNPTKPIVNFPLTPRK